MAYYTGGTNPTLSGVTNSGGTVISLQPSDSTKTAVSLTWTNPNFTFNNGISSLNVGYLVEIDTTGSNFTNSKRTQIGISQSTSLVLTETAINSYLTNQMGLDTSFSHNLEIRIAAYMVTSGAGADTLYSNVMKVTAKPYYPPPAVAPPTTGHLYLVGDATPGGWSNPVPLPDQEFTKISTTLYQITVPLSGGGKHFLFLPLNGDWGNKYACHDGSTQPVTGGDFGYNGGNSYYNADIPGPDNDGTYKIVVDFQVGKYTVTKQ
ncbi:MAG: SusE domain-containing protein [Bacteroidetes bacterium]|nr:SusE domain-containing protein [Bacteroidota bacterium]